MLRWFKVALLVNIMICAIFVGASYYQWELFNNSMFGANLTSSLWNPFQITVLYYFFTDGVIDMVEGIFTYPNAPFMVFWLSPLANMVILAYALKNKEKKEN